MAHRTFVDASGIRWEAWDVIPTMAERRRSDRRVPPPRIPPTMAERRAEQERRHRAEMRVPVRAGHEQGWLAFASAAGNRRLAPIPHGWETLSDTALAMLCARAMPAATTRRRLIE